MRPIVILAAALSWTGAAVANDRAIVLAPVMAMSWEFPTHINAPRGRPTLGVGFWQRGSGAKSGVGSVYAATMEYQLPETLPGRVRSATFQFSGKQAQCTGAEPVVIDVYAYAADGKGEVADAGAGTRVAQMRADCATNPAFNQPIDVTAIVRQLSVPAGIRHVGFNMRKANNRQGPGIFNLVAGKLTVVVSDQDIALRPAAPAVPGAAPPPATAPQSAGGQNGLIRALGTLARGGGTKAARDQAKAEALDGVANLPTDSAAPAAATTPNTPTQ